ncbi:hypothetical protein Tco_0834933 [Tanacetum coccineum]
MDGRGAGSCIMVGSDVRCPQALLFGFPFGEVVSHWPWLGWKRSCVLILYLVVMAKVGASGSGVWLLLIVKRIWEFPLRIASEMEEMFMGGDMSSRRSSWYWTYSSIRFHPSSSVRE